MSERKWSTVAEEYAPMRGAIQLEVQRLEWRDMSAGEETLPFSQGFALREIARNIHGQVTALSWNGVLEISSEETYGLYGLKVEYANASVTAYYLDRGTDVIPLFHDVTFKAEKAA